MRPVDKGVAPNAYAHYREVADDLKLRIGDYCLYCERQIETNLAVEHIQPKSLNVGLQTTWPNFLLGCVNCNSSKGDTPIVLADYFWPDTDNTLRAVEYTAGGLVRPHSGRTGPEQATAQSTIELTGLDKDLGNPDLNRCPSSSDIRWR